MVIAFSNRKGYIGKTSLCAALANYWASNDVPVKVIDVDPQQSLYNARENDLKKHAIKPKYEILKFDLSIQVGEFLESIQELNRLNFNVIFDTPPGVDSNVFMNAIRLSDYIIVPFKYDIFSIDMTGRYSRSLRLLAKRYQQEQKIVYVPNMVENNSEFKHNYILDGRLGSSAESFYGGIKAPDVPLCSCMKKINTLFLSHDELVCLSPCLKYLSELIVGR